MAKHLIPRIEYLRVKNYRALHDLELEGITPLTVFLGPNGSGKSTILDVLAFLSECFTVGLRQAWDKRGRFRELRTRGATGAIVIELKYQEKPDLPVITYYLAIDETSKGPYVAQEWLQWKTGHGKPFKFLDFQEGTGKVIMGEHPDELSEQISEQLNSKELLAVSSLGQFTKYPRVSALRSFISGWYLSYLSAENTRSLPSSESQERLSSTGDNLPNVIHYLKKEHPERLQHILNTLSSRIPRLSTLR